MLIASCGSVGASALDIVSPITAGLRFVGDCSSTSRHYHIPARRIVNTLDIKIFKIATTGRSGWGLHILWEVWVALERDVLVRVGRTGAALCLRRRAKSFAGESFSEPRPVHASVIAVDGQHAADGAVRPWRAGQLLQ